MSINEAGRRVLFVCHTAQRGGGELALLRYVQLRPDSLCSFIFLEDGPLAQAVKVIKPDTIIHKARNPWHAVYIVNSLVRRTRPDVVISNSMRSAIYVGLSMVSREKHVYYVRDFMNASHLSPAKRRFVTLIMFLRVGGIIANSRATLAAVPVARLRERSEVAYSCSGMSSAYIESRRHRLQVRQYSVTRPGTLRILSLSRISPWKGQEMLVAALEILSYRRADNSEIALTVAGTALFGEEKFERQLRQRANRLGYRVDFVGHVDDVTDLLQSHDVLAHTSVSPEPFGQVVVQGLGAGLAVIASAGGGAQEIMESGAGPSGWIWDGKTPESLAVCIEQVLDCRETADERSLIGFDTVLQFCDETAVETLDAAIEGMHKKLQARWQA